MSSADVAAPAARSLRYPRAQTYLHPARRRPNGLPSLTAARLDRATRWLLCALVNLKIEMKKVLNTPPFEK